MINAFVRFFLENKLVVWLLLLLFVGWGLATAPFEFDVPGLPRDPVAVDAIPDIGENQQIVFTQWMGQSPQDVEDQITYPLTSSLLGIPGVKSVRSNSMFGFSSIYLIFEEDVEFYWSRSRILEKLNSLPAGLLPENATPTLGPDATALGQVYWYTLEGRAPDGTPVGGWDLDELRSIQDFYVRYGLSAAGGVSEVASIGGFVKEYQVDVDPEKMRVYGITLQQVMAAVKGSNLDVGAATLEINLAEYFVRGLGYLQNLDDLELAVVSEKNNVPVYLRDVARVTIGPATRRGILDKSGAEAVGGVVVARYGANPLEVINNVKAKIGELAPGLPKRELEDGTMSQVTVVPFYDRSELIQETIGTLEEALTLEILITAIVVILLLFNLKSSLLVAGTLPVAVLMCFIAMRYFGVDANIVALSGIAIAIGTMVDMGIVLTESMVYRLNDPPEGESRLESIYEATVEVGSAVLTAVATTIISFLPVFTMEAAEGKLFRPLAFTKTFALVAAIVVALAIIPALAHSVLGWDRDSKRIKIIGNSLLIGVGIVAWVFVAWWLGVVTILAGVLGVVKGFFGADAGASRVGGAMETPSPTPPHGGGAFKGSAQRFLVYFTPLINVAIALVLAWLLAGYWLPLGVNKSQATNFLFVVVVSGSLLGFFWLVIHFYTKVLGFLLKVKILFLVLIGLLIFAGFQSYRSIGEEFMPALGEGAFLLMPTSMPHAGIEENLRNLRTLDMAVTTVPEVEMVVGKAGRVNSPLDPAPLSMYENMILYKTEYATDADGRRLRFKVDEDGNLTPGPSPGERGDATGVGGSSEVHEINGAYYELDDNGQYYRQWRDHIKSPDDIWEEIIAAAQLPGVTSAPKLQPIETRLVMLQTGMRAPMGIKVRGPDLATIEAFGLELERELKNIDGVKDAAVFADRIVGKPYLLLDVKREIIARYGLSVTDVQQQIMATVGGMKMTTTVEGRERYAVRLRYPRELRDNPEAIKNILVPTRSGQIKLGELIDIRYEQGPQSIKSEDGFLVGYVLFDREEGYSEVEVVENAQAYLDGLADAGNLDIPAGVSYRFAGNYEQQVRANERLSLVVPIALGLIFLILYFQFKSITTALMVFSGVFVAFSGGFLLLGGYADPDFMNFNFFGANLRDLFQMRTINLSVAVWVGFLALFGIATDDGVLVATFLRDSFARNTPETIPEIREAVIEGGLRRVRPAMMTTATTLLALLPVLTATGRGADIMLPMAIPSFGGMALQVVTMFTVPVLWCMREEIKLKFRK
ncbi:efflux RND transporter permease subunit [Neolewinella agarilytica]|uniref:Cu(I)/Ag(I) efflux system membrane protein CusA/SilA n=1 Tax=Neolewinella agarilytica TaxID=478744 RepID=A0A1H9H6T2_9BACT|nr:efflux RND transporter permease subunit [Neolewinella agarilytica]SEQ57918.1 Cu(I)/Ag(I) efflux system membrane protein CusA/SilA [Neolewinella agarilytica]